MNDGFNLTNSDSEVDSMARTHSVLPEDHLATTRLPPLSPPPMRGPGASQPPPSLAPQRQPRTSWWQALLTATFPPAPPRPVTDERIVSRRIGVACGGLSLVLLVISLAVGLRGAPSPFSSSPMVVAALVIARALMALGVLAFGYALLGIGERFFISGSRDTDRGAQ